MGVLQRIKYVGIIGSTAKVKVGIIGSMPRLKYWESLGVLQRLKYMGIIGSTANKVYGNQWEYCKLDKIVSPWSPVKSGIPQGDDAKIFRRSANDDGILQGDLDKLST